MRIIAKRTLVQFWRRHRETEQPLMAWHQTVKATKWTNSAAVKETFAKVSILSNKRAVFDILGGNYRLVAAIDYEHGIVFIKFLGTHREYDRIDAATIDLF